MPEPRLSIVIPTFNEAATVQGLLRDLSAMKTSGVEVIVADGGSDDGTAGLARALADRVITADRGRAAQMNAGARIAKGDLLWFLHADTRVPADAAAAIARRHVRGSQWGHFDVRLSGDRLPLRVIERLMNLRAGASRIATGDQGIFVARTLFDAVGGYPPIALMEDIALSKRLRRLARPARIRKPRLTTSSRRWERDGIARTVLLMWRLRLAYAFGASPEHLARQYR